MLRCILILAIFCCSCSKTEKEHPIAKAYGNELFLNDVKNQLTNAENSQDSIAMLKAFVADWLQDQVKAHEAVTEGNLSDEKTERLVEAYRSDLIVHSMEEEYLANNLDTAVTNKEMRTYFDQNQQNFQLSKNLVKLVFVKIKDSQKLKNELAPLIKTTDTDSKKKLLESCTLNAVNWYLNDEQWLNFEDIVKEIPIKTYDEEQYLQNNKYVEIKEGEYIYLVYIVDYKIKNAPSEFEFEKERIKQIILNKRKKLLLEGLNQRLMKEATLKKEIESFVD